VKRRLVAYSLLAVVVLTLLVAMGQIAYYPHGSSWYILGLSFRVGPDGRRPSERDGCPRNLRQLQSAVDQWALETKKDRSAQAPSQEDLKAYLEKRTWPLCPEGGTYQLGPTITDLPRCSFHRPNP
jgi:hypothetical protein